MLAVAAAAALRLAFHSVLGLQVPYWSFTVAVIVAAWVGGRGPSLAAAALSALAAKWLFVAPTHSFAIADPAAAWGLGLFVITIVPIGLMIVSLRGGGPLSHRWSSGGPAEATPYLQTNLAAFIIRQT